MNLLIREMTSKDKLEVLSMMKEFYSSDAVSTNGSDEIFNNDFDNCINNNPYLKGFVFYSNNTIGGYAMIAKSFSTEFGKPCIWFEDLYLKPEFRGFGIIPSFIKYIKQNYPECIYRLEVEKENTHAVHVYKKQGFSELPYTEMKLL